MESIHLEPDITAFNFVLLACASSENLPTVGTEALNLLSMIQKRGILPNVFSFINIVRACTRAQQPHLISDLLTSKETTDNYSWEFYNAAITVFHQGAFFAEADAVYQAAVEKNIIQPWVAEEDLDSATNNPLHVHSMENTTGTFKKNAAFERKINVIDLHCLTVPLAHATVRYALHTIQREMDEIIVKERHNGDNDKKESKETTIVTTDSNPKSIRDHSLTIITGIGKRSINKLEPVIRPQVQDMLLEQFYPPLSSMTMTGNTGRVLVTQEAIQEWVETAKRVGLHPVLDSFSERD
jgi:hypothetical protein